MKQIILSLTMLLFMAVNVQAQIKVRGVVKTEKGQPIEFASVKLVHSSKKVFGGITHEDGGYTVTCPTGSATLTISMIGYEKEEIRLDLKGDTYVGETTLKEKAKKLGDVVVTAQKPLVRREVDRIILDASQLSKVSNNAIDLLKQTPGLIVSDEGDIRMLGKGNIIVLINDRETHMSPQELVTVLRTYRSADISAIEVMPTPPAGYTASGDAGIINIRMKERVKDYMGGTISDQQSISPYYINDLSTGLWYTKNSFSSFLNISGGFGNFTKDIESQTEHKDTRWSQQEHRRQSNNYVVVRAGFDKNVGKDFSFGSQAAYTFFTPSRNVNLTFDNLTKGVTDSKLRI